MQEPKRAAETPVVLNLEPNTYWYCTCGQSTNQPWCDGAHVGSGFQPIKYDVTEASRVALCRCKVTGKAPLCDGSHARPAS